MYEKGMLQYPTCKHISRENHAEVSKQLNEVGHWVLIQCAQRQRPGGDLERAAGARAQIGSPAVQDARQAARHPNSVIRCATNNSKGLRTR